MSERLEKWHVEADPATETKEIVRGIRILEMDMRDPEISPRRGKELDKRIGHLVFEYHKRKTEGTL